MSSNITLQKQMAKANKVCEICKKYHIRWRLDTNGITIYYNNNDYSGMWFHINSVELAEELVLSIANSCSTSQDTLDRYL